MKTQNLLLLLALACGAYLLFKKQNNAPASAPAAAPVAPMVEEILYQHAGEDSPIVHAFEEALEEKAKHGA